MTIDPVLNGDPAPLVVVPLPHQGGVALSAGEHGRLLVRAPAAQWGLQLLEEREEWLGLEAGVAVGRHVERIVGWAFHATDVTHYPGRIVTHSRLVVMRHSDITEVRLYLKYN